MSTNIFKSGWLLDLDVRFWSGAINLTQEDLGIDKVSEAYRLGRKYLIPEEMVKEYRKIEGEARYIVESNSFQFPIGNAHFITKKRFETVVGKLKDCQTRYAKVVQKLIDNYEDYKAAMLPEYRQAAEDAFIRSTPETMTFGPDYDREAERNTYVNAFLARINSCYPPVHSFNDRFSLTWDVYEIALPRMHKADEQDLIDGLNKQETAQKEYEVQIHSKINGFVDKVVSVLRQETSDICARVVKNIQDGKVVKTSTIKSLQSFIERFKDLNFVGDVQVEEQLKALNDELLNSYPASQFGEDQSLQEELKRKLVEIGETVNVTDLNSVTGEYKRKVVWE
jgi:hypothetical protein